MFSSAPGITNYSKVPSDIRDAAIYRERDNLIEYLTWLYYYAHANDQPIIHCVKENLERENDSRTDTFIVKSIDEHIKALENLMQFLKGYKKIFSMPIPENLPIEVRYRMCLIYVLSDIYNHEFIVHGGGRFFKKKTYSTSALKIKILLEEYLKDYDNDPRKPPAAHKEITESVFKTIQREVRLILRGKNKPGGFLGFNTRDNSTIALYNSILKRFNEFSLQSPTSTQSSSPSSSPTSISLHSTPPIPTGMEGKEEVVEEDKTKKKVKKKVEKKVEQMGINQGSLRNFNT